MKIIKSILKTLQNLDAYQLLTIPVLVIILLFGFDFKQPVYKIGIVLPLEGEFKARAQSHINGINLAISHINALGGINDKKIVPIIKDCGVSQEQAVEITRDLVYDKAVMAVVGGFTPANTRAIQAVTEGADIPFITGICTHFDITNTASGYSFRTVTDDKRQFEALVEYSSKKYNISNPAIIYDEELYGMDSAHKYAEIALKFRQEILQVVPYKKGTLNFKKALEQVLISKADALVVLAPSYDSAILLRQAREARFDRPILGANQFASNEFLNFAGIHSESVITTLPFNNRAGGQKSEYFSNEYMDKFKQNPDADAAMGYESIMVMALALRVNGENSKALRESLSATHGWESIVGSGGFDQDGNQVRPAEIAIIKDKQLIPISMEDLF